MTVTEARQPGVRVVPALVWLRGYRRAWLVPDLVGGLAAGAVVVPQAMAYATIADLPPEVGLYTCMVPMAVYALLGGSRTLSVSTTSTVAVLTGSTLLAADVAASSDDPGRALATLTVLVGLIMLAARLLRLGSLIDNVSEATLTGIKAGVGLTVAAGQVPKLLGIAGDPDATAFFGEVAGVWDDLGETNRATVILSIVTILLLVALARLAPRLPAPLLAVVLGIVLVAGWSIDDRGVALIDEVPSGLPLPVLPTTDDLGALIGGAFAIALMCFMETASVAAAVRRRDEPPIDNNQELTANAATCILGGLFRAMPSSGGFSQTAINQRSGSVTQLSGIVTVSLAVACALFLGSLLSDMPQATLGSLVVVAVIGLIAPGEFVRYWRLDRISFWVSVLTAVAGLVFGLLAAVLVGVLCTLFMILVELNRVGLVELEPSADGDDVRVVSSDTRPQTGLLILRVDGPLYTANVRNVVREVLDIAHVRRPDTVLLDLSALPQVTLTVTDQLDELDQSLRAQGIALWLAAISPRALKTARRLPEWDRLTRARALDETVHDAILRHRVERS